MTLQLRRTLVTTIGLSLGILSAFGVQLSYVRLFEQREAYRFLQELEPLGTNLLISKANRLAVIAPTQDIMVMAQYALAPKLLMPVEPENALSVSKQLVAPCLFLLHRDRVDGFANTQIVTDFSIDSVKQEPFATLARGLTFFSAARCL